MNSLIAALLFAILFSGDVYCQSVGKLTDSSEEVNSTSTSNSSNPLLDVHMVFHGAKNRMQTLIGNILESNGTDLVASNDSLANSTSSEEEGLTSLSVNNTQLDQTTTLTESPDYEDDYSTETRFDPSGCDTHLRDKHEDNCYENFQNSLTESMDIEDEAAKGKHICCAAEGYERCCVIGYQQANCKADHNAIKENLKAARMFMATLSDISCSIHRGKCDFNSAASLSPLYSLLLVTLGLLPVVFLL